MKRNLWPYALIAWFVLFIGGLATWASFAIRHEDQLVGPDYYEREIKYQSQMERIERAASLGARVELDCRGERKTLLVSLPVNAVSGKTPGRIQLYRPSDAKLDRETPLAPGAGGSQSVDVSGLRSGLWRVRLSWTAGGGEYFFEKQVVIPGP